MGAGIVKGKDWNRFACEPASGQRAVAGRRMHWHVIMKLSVHEGVLRLPSTRFYIRRHDYYTFTILIIVTNNGYQLLSISSLPILVIDSVIIRLQREKKCPALIRHDNIKFPYSLEPWAHVLEQSLELHKTTIIPYNSLFSALIKSTSD